MPEYYKIALETEAASIGGGTEAVTNKFCTKSRAIDLGCRQDDLVDYESNQLVKYNDLHEDKVINRIYTQLSNSGYLNYLPSGSGGDSVFFVLKVLYTNGDVATLPRNLSDDISLDIRGSITPTYYSWGDVISISDLSVSVINDGNGGYCYSLSKDKKGKFNNFYLQVTYGGKTTVDQPEQQNCQIVYSDGRTVNRYKYRYHINNFGLVIDPDDSQQIEGVTLYKMTRNYSITLKADSYLVTNGIKLTLKIAGQFAPHGTTDHQSYYWWVGVDDDGNDPDAFHTRYTDYTVNNELSQTNGKTITDGYSDYSAYATQYDVYESANILSSDFVDSQGHSTSGTYTDYVINEYEVESY